MTDILIIMALVYLAGYLHGKGFLQYKVTLNKDKEKDTHG